VSFLHRKDHAFSVQFVLVGMAKVYNLMLFYVIFSAAISEPENKREYPPPIKVGKFCSCLIPTEIQI
jgi:hypothetical protein